MTDMDKIIERHKDYIITAWQGLLKTEGGRAVVYSILEECKVFQSTYTGNADTNFNEGKRAIGLHILQERIFPNGARLFALMVDEHQQREEEIERAIEIEEQEQSK